MANRPPLAGRRILVVRPAEQGLASAVAVRATGAEPVLAPLIELLPPEDGGAALAAAIQRLASYNWLVVTSANGANRIVEALSSKNSSTGSSGPSIWPPSLRVAAIGPATAAAIAEAGTVVTLLPDRYVAEGLLEVFPRPSQPFSDGDSGRVLLVRAAVARDVLPRGLRAKGWSVDVVDAYRAVPRTLTAAERAVAADCDTVIFTSPSVVDSFCNQPEALPLPPTVAAIGPVTAAAARRQGLPVHVEATEHTVEGLMLALAAHVD